jgi:purine nucleosidase
MATRIWLDTDLGTDVDDALALAFALRHPELELAGVSTVFGDVELRARMVEALLRLAGAEGPPVLAGLGKPLTENRIGIMLGHEGQGLLTDASPRIRTDSDPDGARRVDALAQAIEGARADALVAIGPLTNVAALLRAGSKLPRLSIMGGKTAPVTIEGVTPTIDEWNWHCDPDAVATLLGQRPPSAGLPRVFPAEITFRTPISPADHAALAGGDALCRSLASLAEIWLGKLAEIGSQRPQIFLHDPLTVASLPAPDLCPMQPLRLERDGASGCVRRPGPANVELAVDVDPQRIRDLVMDTLLGALVG